MQNTIDNLKSLSDRVDESPQYSTLKSYSKVYREMFKIIEQELSPEDASEEIIETLNENESVFRNQYNRISSEINTAIESGVDEDYLEKLVDCLREVRETQVTLKNMLEKLVD